MKNIHVLPTDKPSILIKNIWENTFSLVENFNTNHIDFKANHMYITSDEEIKDGYYLDLTHNIIMKSVFYPSSDKNCKKIILTTDQDLIKDGVRKIDDGFLDWFVKNPTCEFVEVETEAMFKGYMTFPESINESPFYGNLKHKIIIPKEEHKQETPEEETLSKIKFVLSCNNDAQAIRLLEQYGQWQQERSYSEEEVKILLRKFFVSILDEDKITMEDWFEQFKKK